MTVSQEPLQRENLIGRTLRDGEYLVQRLLGQGGMGKVFLVTHSALTFPLALKQVRADRPLPENASAELDCILRGEDPMRLAARGSDEKAFPSSGGEYTDRFLREALLLARLQHPAIPTLYDYFSTDGYWYLVMDYIPGSTLSSYLSMHAPLPPLEALNYAMQLCDVLEYLHRQTPPVVFRDLKPANVMLVPDGSLMLIDFGIARYVQEQLDGSSDPGSPGYLAPEQCQGEGQADIRSDLYSLGVILHEMLSGQRPQGIGKAFDTLAHVNPTISTQLHSLVQLATRPTPESRFQSAHTLYLALERAYTAEEKRAYLRYVQGQTMQGDASSARDATVPAQSAMHVPQDAPVRDARSSAAPMLSFDLQRRRQTREILVQARHERLMQEQLEQQLASVDEGLLRRSSSSLSHISLRALEEIETMPMLNTRVRQWQRLIVGSFLFALFLFLVMVSLLVYVHITRHTVSLPTVHVTPGSTSSSASFWQVLPSLAGAEADNASVYMMVQGRAYMYINGGYQGARPVSYDRNLYRYDIAAAHWEVATSKPFPALVNDAAVVDEAGRIFFTAGYSPANAAVASLLYMYQPIRDTLQKITPPAQAPVGFGGTLLADGQNHLYITQGFMHGGDSHSQAGTGWYRYDIGAGQWHTLAPLPLGLGYAALAADDHGGILLLGGATDAGQHNLARKTYRYDIAHDRWLEVPITSPRPFSGAASCLVWPGRLVVLGGYDSAHDKGLQQAWLFDVHTLRWSPLTPPPFGGSVLGTAACDGQGHVFLARGGSDTRTPRRDFWELVIPPVREEKR